VRVRVLIVAAVAALLLFTVGALSVRATQTPKVYVCHATSSESNPYVTIEVPATESGYPQGHFTENGTQEAGHEEDYLGPCESSPTPSPSPTPTGDDPDPTPTPSPSVTPGPTNSPPPSSEPTTKPSSTPDRGALPPTDTEAGTSEPPVSPAGAVVLIYGGFLAAAVAAWKFLDYRKGR
jgi:outer membrane biosynthesis protein TonB